MAAVRGPEFPVDAIAAAHHLTRLYGQPVTAGRLRVWAHRHPDELTRFGRRGRRTTYDLGQIEALARKILGEPSAFNR